MKTTPETEAEIVGLHYSKREFAEVPSWRG